MGTVRNGNYMVDPVDWNARSRKKKNTAKLKHIVYRSSTCLCSKGLSRIHGLKVVFTLTRLT